MARPTLTSHPKFAKLAARLRSRALARGVLELLWESCYASGEPCVGDAVSVEGIADWRGKRGDLAFALVDSGFLDQTMADGGRSEYLVHDLEDHAPDYVLKRWEREANRRAAGKTLRQIRKDAAAARWNSESDGLTRSERLAAARTIGTHTDVEWAEMVAFFGCCVKCGDASGGIMKDHIVPLYQGGSDAIANLQPLCRRCNSGKGADTTDHRTGRSRLRPTPATWAVTPANVGQTSTTVTPPAHAPITDLSVSSLPSLSSGSGSDAGAGSEGRAGPAALTGFSLRKIFSEVRSRVVGGMPWQTPRVAEGKDASMAELINADQAALADVVPTIELLFKLAKAGRAGDRSDVVLRDGSFAFGAWCSQWTALREQLHGKGPDAAAAPGAPILPKTVDMRR